MFFFTGSPPRTPFSFLDKGSCQKTCNYVGSSLKSYNKNILFKSESVRTFKTFEEVLYWVCLKKNFLNTNVKFKIVKVNKESQHSMSIHVIVNNKRTKECLLFNMSFSNI